MDKETTIAIHRRLFAQREEHLRVDLKQWPEYQANGWLPYREPITAPHGDPPDIEVLELKVKDANVRAEEAERIAKIERNRVEDATRFLQAAKHSLHVEEELKRQIAEDAEKEEIKIKCMSVLRAATEPVPLKTLFARASTPTQEQYVRENFMSDVVGVTADGDRLIMLNSVPFLREKAEKERRAAMEKEATIRARMEAN